MSKVTAGTNIAGWQLGDIVIDDEGIEIEMDAIVINGGYAVRSQQDANCINITEKDLCGVEHKITLSIAELTALTDQFIPKDQGFVVSPREVWAIGVFQTYVGSLVAQSQPINDLNKIEINSEVGIALDILATAKLIEEREEGDSWGWSLAAKEVLTAIDIDYIVEP